MKLLIFLFLSLGAVAVVPFERYGHYFRYTSDGVKTIKDPSQPLRLGSTDFYWDGHFKESLGKPVRCEVEFKSEEWTLGDIRFEDGTTPHSVHYSCPAGAKCAYLSCLSDDIRLSIAICIILIFLFLLCACNIYYRRQLSIEKALTATTIPVLVTALPPFTDDYEEEEGLDAGYIDEDDEESGQVVTENDDIPPPPYHQIIFSRENLNTIP